MNKLPAYCPFCQGEGIIARVDDYRLDDLVPNTLARQQYECDRCSRDFIIVFEVR